MATDGLDLGLGSEMGLTCKHEFQSWTCVVVMKIRPPLKVERENDMHMPPANPPLKKSTIGVVTTHFPPSPTSQNGGVAPSP